MSTRNFASRQLLLNTLVRPSQVCLFVFFFFWLTSLLNAVIYTLAIFCTDTMYFSYKDVCSTEKTWRTGPRSILVSGSSPLPSLLRIKDVLFKVTPSFN